MLTELMLTYLSTPTYTVPSSVKFNIKEIAQSLPFVSARNMLRVTLQFDGHLPGLSIINISGLIDSNTPTASGKSQWLNECVRVLFSDLLIFKIAHNYLSTLTFEQSMHVCACINLIWLSGFPIHGAGSIYFAPEVLPIQNKFHPPETAFQQSSTVALSNQTGWTFECSGLYVEPNGRHVATHSHEHFNQRILQWPPCSSPSCTLLSPSKFLSLSLYCSLFVSLAPSLSRPLNTVLTMALQRNEFGMAQYADAHIYTHIFHVEINNRAGFWVSTGQSGYYKYER